ncbi:hypothetical protein DNM18_20885 [Salmonella enterica subsp. enterica]|nr:hypothetical protein [Salmonella enterica subsp. enterica serovar Poona]ECW2669551.1 hypothetical protein [Salmonella enterica]EBU7356869.1 hypothetical protein [Salmonella enterica subsp. enterica serovar Poona]ECA2557751.1 hypothetical protein [Salmonella enterica subsp. enterica serovar Poona]ECD3887443.1 hypothetical protein [Salmonella enterica subsp. enterica serovar Poona]
MKNDAIKDVITFLVTDALQFKKFNEERVQALMKLISDIDIEKRRKERVEKNILNTLDVFFNSPADAQCKTLAKVIRNIVDTGCSETTEQTLLVQQKQGEPDIKSLTDRLKKSITKVENSIPCQEVVDFLLSELVFVESELK